MPGTAATTSWKRRQRLSRMPEAKTPPVNSRLAASPCLPQRTTQQNGQSTKRNPCPYGSLATSNGTRAHHPGPNQPRHRLHITEHEREKRLSNIDPKTDQRFIPICQCQLRTKPLRQKRSVNCRQAQTRAATSPGQKPEVNQATSIGHREFRPAAKIQSTAPMSNTPSNASGHGKSGLDCATRRII